MEELLGTFGGYIVAGVITLVVLIACCVINNKLLKN